MVMLRQDIIKEYVVRERHKNILCIYMYYVNLFYSEFENNMK